MDKSLYKKETLLVLKSFAVLSVPVTIPYDTTISILVMQNQVSNNMVASK